MTSTSPVDFTNSRFASQPYPHFYVDSIFPQILESELLNWLENTQVWEKTVTEFYEQYEFSLLERPLPAKLACLVGAEVVDVISRKMEQTFGTAPLALAGVTVHKLTDGQRIGVHNDFLGAEESHRLIIQLNTNWTEANGGYLLLFNSAKAEDVSELVLPVSNSAFGFEISPVSHHAVSTVYNFSRYTLVYTFNVK